MRFKCNILILMCFVAFLWSPDVRATPGNWSQRTARLLPAGRAELLLLGPSRYAFQERVELGVSLVSFFALPNVQLKLAWPEQGEWAVATRHRAFMPSTLMNLLEGKALDAAPARVVLDTDLLMTRARRDGWVTVQMGAAWLPCCGADPFEMPGPMFLRPRVPTTSSSEGTVGVRGGVIARRFIGWDGWFVEGEGQVHLVPVERATWLELDAVVGLERRHFFVQCGARSAHDGARLVTLPRIELGVAIE